jgi:putative heme-binding domain-containing protein
MSRLLALALVLFAQQSKPLNDEKQLLAGIKAPPGFTVTIFAQPPDVGYPTCLAAAPDGTLFVGVDENGSIDAKPNRGRVIRCVDTDGDGRADKFTVFAPNVDSPRGLAWDGKTLYVLHPPFIRAFHDDDGDGVAERSEVLVQGLGFDLKFRGADHTTNGMTLGIDGRLYIAVGDYGFVKATGLDGKSVQLHGGGVACVRVDGTGLEIVSRGQRNIYDVAIDPCLNAFTRDNTNDGGGWDVRLSHVVAGANFGYPTLFRNFPDEIVKPLADYGGGSPCGSIYVQEPGLPEGLGDTLYTCEWGRNAVFRHPLEPAGATFKAQQKPFVEIQRPTDMEVDGRGRFYISSWKNGQFTYAGPNVGFVARLSASSASDPVVDLAKATVETLLAELASASHVRRFHAQRELLRRPGKADLAAPLEKLASTEGPLGPRVAALFTLKQLGKQDAVLARLSTVPALREYALRALDDLAKPLVDGLTDPNPRVRLQAVTGLLRLQKTDVAAAIFPLTEDPDPVVAHVAVNALVALRPIALCWQRQTPAAFRILSAIHDPAIVAGASDALGAQPKPELRLSLLRLLCRLYFREADWDGRWWGTRPDTTGPYFKPVAWEGTKQIESILTSELQRKDPAPLRALLVELQRHRISLPETVPITIKLAGEDPAFRPIAAELLGRMTPMPPEAVALLEETAASAAAEAGVRSRALTSLVRANRPDASEAAIRVMTTWQKPSGEMTALRDEFARDARHAGAAAAWVKRSEADSAPVRELAFGVLLNVVHRKQSPKEAREAANRAIDQALAAPRAVDLLRAVTWTRVDDYALQIRSLQKDGRPEIREAAQRAAAALKLDAPGGADRVTIKTLPYEKVLAEALPMKGDPKAGADLFARQGCIACHTVSPNDPPKGPFLGDIAARYPRAELLESILKPNAKIAQGFATHWFETFEEDRYEGFVVRESGDEVEIRNILGVATVLPLKTVKKRGKLETSIMPVGLVEPLTVPELASILAYLESLKK